jgi:bifunctional non-homologous end joining protein LigD
MAAAQAQRRLRRCPPESGPNATRVGAVRSHARRVVVTDLAGLPDSVRAALREVMAFEARRTSFSRLQGHLGITDPHVARASRIRIHYYLFDLLHPDRKSTTDIPLTWRKRLLRNAIEFGDPLRNTPHRVEDSIAAYQAACQRGDEGVIAKLADSKYGGGRSTNWLKFKCVRDQEFVIGGYTAPKGSRIKLGASLIGYHEGRDLVYAGKVGTGFDEATLRGCTRGCRPSNRTRRRSPAE